MKKLSKRYKAMLDTVGAKINESMSIEDAVGFVKKISA